MVLGRHVLPRVLGMPQAELRSDDYLASEYKIYDIDVQ